MLGRKVLLGVSCLPLISFFCRCKFRLLTDKGEFNDISKLGQDDASLALVSLRGPASFASLDGKTLAVWRKNRGKGGWMVSFCTLPV